MGNNHLKVKVRLLILGIFLLGNISGGLAVSLYHARAEKNAANLNDQRSPRSTTTRLTKDLNLSSEQSASLEKILENSAAEYHNLFEEIRPRMDTVRAAARQQMRALLSPEQQKKFDQITQEIDKRREEEHRKAR